jgi:hypothetical protein
MTRICARNSLPYLFIAPWLTNPDIEERPHFSLNVGAS